MKNQIANFGICFFGSLVCTFALVIVIPVVVFDIYDELGMIFTVISSISAPIIFYLMYNLCRKAQSKSG